VWNGSGNGDSDGNSVLYGEADRYYVHRMQLDENGQARAAAAAYLEAATLYQCCLDFDPSSSQNPFGHVTSSTEIQSLLASVALRLAHVNQDALGDPKSATRLYKDVCYKMKFPSDTALDGMGTSLEASGKKEEALDAYQSALKLNPNNHRVKFHLAVLLERLTSSTPEYEEESTKLMEELRRSEAVYACLVDSWGYVRWHTRRQPDANLYRGTKQMLQVGIQAALPLISSGLVCEFGVAQGRSLRLIQELCPLQTPIYGSDTFTGLPMACGAAIPAGAFSTNGVLPSLGGAHNFYRLVQINHWHSPTLIVFYIPVHWTYWKLCTVALYLVPSFVLMTICVIHLGDKMSSEPGENVANVLDGNMNILPSALPHDRPSSVLHLHNQIDNQKK